MAHFWISNDGWAVVPLAGDSYWLGGAFPLVHGLAASPAPAEAVVLLRASANGAAGSWLLLAPLEQRFTVNGEAPWTGLVALRDRDEVRLADGQRLYFSSEHLPQIVPFPGSEHEIICARCRNPIPPGTLAVRCPACGTWCHQTTELPCWSYQDTTHCPLCEQSNDPEAGFRWTPEELSHAS